MSGVMKKIQIIVFLIAALLSLAAAQSLPALTPPGAVGGFYTRNLSVKKAFFVDFQAEWNRLGINDLIFNMIEDDPDFSEGDIDDLKKFFTIDIIGREAILVFYANGDFFFLTRPAAKNAAEIISAVRDQLDSPKQRGGWLVEENEEDGIALIVGVSSDAILIASPEAANRFFSGDRGLKIPVSGDIAAWFKPQPLWEYLDNPDLNLPPSAIAAIKTFTGLASASNFQIDGVYENSSFCLDPNQDSDLAKIFLTSDSAWDLATLPHGLSATSGVIDLPALGRYVNRWAAEFNFDIDIDLSSFGTRFALIDAGSENPQQALQNPMGSLLLLLETQDSLTAEVTLLSWLQMAAAFATPEGEGGFSVEPIAVNGRDGKAIQLGLTGTIYLVSYDDHLALATSKDALDLLTAPKLGSDPDFSRLSKMLPANYWGASYGNYNKTLKQAAQIFPLMMMQSIGDAETQQITTELTMKLSQFFVFMADRTGGAISYTKQKNKCLVSSGFIEVNW